jgi:hypothetical protein
MSYPSRFSQFYHPHDSGLALQFFKLLIMKFSPLPCYLVPLRPKYSPDFWFCTARWNFDCLSVHISCWIEGKYFSKIVAALLSRVVRIKV